MTIELPVVITIASLMFSTGMFMGIFTSRFVNKKECQQKSDAMWAQVDAIRNCMTGGKIKFELRMVPPDKECL